MPGKEFNVVAVLYPKKGKADQLVEMLDEVAKYVRDNKDQESLKVHGSSKPFTEFQNKLKELDLIRAPPVSIAAGNRVTGTTCLPCSVLS